MPAPPAPPAGRQPGAEPSVEVARVLRAHGLRGEIVALTHSEEPDVLRAASEVLLDGVPGAIPHRVLGIRSLGRRKDGRWELGLRLAGIEDRSRAEVWIGAGVQVPAEALEAARGDDLYWRDLIGLQCRGPDGEPLGSVTEIWATAGPDVLVVDGPAGRLLLPAVDEVLVRVDRAAGEVWVQPPEPPPPESPGSGTGE